MKTNEQSNDRKRIQKNFNLLVSQTSPSGPLNNNNDDNINNNNNNNNNNYN